MTLATLVADVILNTSGFTAGVNEAKTQLNTLQSQLSTTGATAQTTGSILATTIGTGLGTLIADGLRDALGAMWDFAQDSVQYAAEMETAGRRIDTVFGGNAENLNRWAETTQDAFGVAEGAAKINAARIGSLLDTYGFATDEIYSMSTALVELGGDLSAFTGFDFDTTMQKLYSGLRGETEAIEDLGLDVRVASLAAFAGIKESDFGKMDSLERMRITYEYIMSASEKAQGFFAKNNDTYSAQMAEFNANIAQLKQAIGESLLPVITELLTWFNGLFGSAENAASGIDTLKDSSKDNLFTIESTTSKALALVDALAELGESAEEAGDAGMWNAIFAELEQTIPGIGNLIDAETGKIEGGTKALKEYTEAWQVFALEQAKQQAVQSMYDDYAQLGYEITQMKYDQYIADTLEADAQAEQERIVSDLAQKAFEKQKENAEWSVTADSLDAWTDIVRDYLQTGHSYHLSAGNEFTGGMSLEDIDAEQLSVLFDEYQRWEKQRAEYAAVDNAADIAEMQAELTKFGKELATLSQMFSDEINAAIEAGQVTAEEIDTVRDTLNGTIEGLEEAEESLIPEEPTYDEEFTEEDASEWTPEEIFPAESGSSEGVTQESAFGTGEFSGTIVVHVYLDGQELGDIITERVEANIAREAATGSKTN